MARHAKSFIIYGIVFGIMGMLAWIPIGQILISQDKNWLMLIILGLISAAIQLIFTIVIIMHIERKGDFSGEVMKSDISANFPPMLKAMFLACIYLIFYLIIFTLPVTLFSITTNNDASGDVLNLLTILAAIPIIIVILRYMLIPYFVLLGKHDFYSARRNSIELINGYKFVVFLFLAILSLIQNIPGFINEKLLNISINPFLEFIIQYIWDYSFNLLILIMFYVFWKKKNSLSKPVS